MRFIGLMMVRDEDDIIAQTLSHLLSWIDALYVIDLGSTDQTWEIIQDAATKDKRVVPYMSKPILYVDSLRSVLFHHYRERFRPGDWIMKIDADEFYHVPPPQFVSERVGRLEGCLHLLWYFFRLTTDEVSAYESGLDVMGDRKRPIEQRRRMYKIASYSEPRMFRYRRSMRWYHTNNWPFNTGYVARERIPIRHYPHRDPLQMQKRYRLRAAMMRLGAATGPHWILEDWRKDVVDLALSDSGRLEQTTDEGLAAAPGHTDSELREWLPGTPLPELQLNNHLANWRKRLAQRMIYPLLVPLIDRRRPKYSPDYVPPFLPHNVNDEVANTGLIRR